MDKEARKSKNALSGVLHLHYETGYEGSPWAFQDERYMSKVLPGFGVWGNQEVWDSADPKRRGKTRDDAEVFCNGKWYPLPDPLQKDPDYVKSSLFRGGARGDREADKRLMKKYSFIIKYAADRGGTPFTEPSRPYGICAGELTRATVDWEDGVVDQRLSNSLLVMSWDYGGLHILKSGDELTVHDKDNPSRVVWSGVIQLHTRWGDNPKDPSCLIQKGIDQKAWERWFIDEYPAMLVRP